VLIPKLPESGAIFNSDRTRRFWLGRRVDGVDSQSRLFICAVQPTTADETEDDPTILREMGFARRWGFGWLDKVNIFDLCSPDPKTLYESSSPVSAENDSFVFAAAARGSLHLCAWGNHGAYLARGARMRRLLTGLGYQLHVFGLTKEGYPIHPLARGKMRVPDDAQPLVWR